METIKKILSNEHLKSWVATLLVYVTVDIQEILVNIALGDWSALTFKLLIMTVLRSIVKGAIIITFPTTKKAIEEKTVKA